METKNSSSNRVTIADIARESGVSPATVSLVLRDKPGVSDETRQRVLDCAQALGYIFVPSVQSQTALSVSTIGLVIKVRPDDDPLTNSFYAPVIAGIEAVCRQYRLNMLYATMPVDAHNTPLDLPPMLTDQPPDGLLLVGMQLPQAFLEILQRQKLPVVLVDAYAPGDPYDAVITANAEGAYRAVSYLIEQGHRHIAILGSQPDAYPSVQERRQGYLKAIQEHGLTPYFADCDLWPDAARPAAEQLLQEHPHITAVFSCNDETAIAAMQVARQAGRQVPEELSVIGFDNIALAQHVSPPLTTMRVDKLGMGRLAAQLLVNRIEFPQAGLVRAVIQPELIERDSVCRSTK
ncbi:MAG: LacI family transcriptional regulator [Chloroflexi bacterium]|nr:MAG: LacI family transcriptional regulator [Chloroflexota bacterium]